jgi:hypothetical protein
MVKYAAMWQVCVERIFYGWLFAFNIFERNGKRVLFCLQLIVALNLTVNLDGHRFISSAMLRSLRNRFFYGLPYPCKSLTIFDCEFTRLLSIQ